MRFLALTAFQSATLALLTTAAIIALYFLKHRRRRLVVSSALLWKRVLAKHLENSLFERLRRILSILIAVAIGLLVAMSIAQPEIEWLTGKTSAPSSSWTHRHPCRHVEATDARDGSTRSMMRPRL